MSAYLSPRYKQGLGMTMMLLLAHAAARYGTPMIEQRLSTTAGDLNMIVAVASSV